MTRRRLHRALAVVLALFLIAHLGNHLAGLAGQDMHGAVQDALRLVYRNRLVEIVLLLAVTVQVAVGLALLAAQPRLTLQTGSGAYLALFLMIHVGAVLSARWQGTDTTLAFAAAGLHANAPWPLVFSVYYGVAVAAVFAHVSVPLERRKAALGNGVLGLGVAMAAVLVAMLLGLVHPLIIPQALITAFP